MRPTPRIIRESVGIALAAAALVFSATAVVPATAAPPPVSATISKAAFTCLASSLAERNDQYTVTGAISDGLPSAAYAYHHGPLAEVTDPDTPLGLTNGSGALSFTDVLITVSFALTGGPGLEYHVLSGSASEAGGTTTLQHNPGCLQLVAGSARAGLKTGNVGLVQQTDGNLVMRIGTRAVWSTGTVGHLGASSLNLQSDGNLVVRGPSGQALWSSGTYGHPGSTVSLQTDGNLVVRSPSGQALWSTGVHH